MDCALQKHGTIDVEMAKDIITFLSPAKSPGYWTDEYIKGEPMTALIEGSISVCDLRALRIHTLGGYWCDQWISLALSNYVGTPQQEQWLPSQRTSPPPPLVSQGGEHAA